MKRTASFWINHLKLTEHVEGGAFAEVYRSGLVLPQSILPNSFKGKRAASTSIYFLLQYGQFSAFHRIASDEVWHFYQGSPLHVYEIQENGDLMVHRLGNNPDLGETFQCVIRSGSWFGSRTEVLDGYSLVGCTVAPGFDFEDFELAERNSLIHQYPQHTALIESLTH